MRPFLTTGVLFAVLFTAVSAEAQTSYPMVMSLHPTAVQTGSTIDCTVKSRYDLSGTLSVWVSGEGVTAEPLHPKLKEGEKPKSTTALKLKFTVTADAAPGVREFRLATVNGASTVGQLVVVRDPVVAEQAKNNTREEAQEVTLPAAICGTIERNEDVDFFKFHADTGQKICFHVRSMRLENKIHDLQQHSDPLISIRNATGSTVASSDNYFYGDPFLCHEFKQAGDYFLEIRDVRYQGNQYWEYCVEANSRPFVMNAYPLGVTHGQTASLTLIGKNLPEDHTAEWTAPADASGEQFVRVPLGDDKTDPVPLYVTDLPTVLEADQPDETPEQAQPVSLPVGINGVISKPADLDYYKFTAKKGEKFSFEVKARRLGSALDSIIRIVDAKGRQLAENDDLSLYKRTFSDSWIESWTAPADGEFFLEIRDLHLRGGEEYVYFIAIDRVQPYFDLYLDTDKTQITPGNYGALFVKVIRKNGFAGGVTLFVDGLPEGVTASTGRILPGKPADGCIVFHTPAETKPGMWNISIRGEAEQPMGDDQKPLQLVSTAVPYEEIYQPGGGRGHWPVLTHTVAVSKPGDLHSLKVSSNDVVLKPGESKTIDVTIERANGFSKNVTLDMLFQHLARPFADTLPPGVTIDKKKSKTLLTGKELKGKITLKAADNAEPVEKQQCCVMGNIALNFVMKWTYSSEPVFITVLPKK